MKRLSGTLALIVLVGCDTLPRDIDDTSDRVARTRVIRVGMADAPSPEARRFLTDLSVRTKATVQQMPGSLEPLLDALDDDRIDLIVAPVRAEGLLGDAVSLTPPLNGSDEGDQPVQWRAAARNGENRWIMTIERAARGDAAR